MIELPNSRSESSRTEDDTIDDSELVRRAQEELPHGTVAFRALVELYPQRVFLRAKRLVGSTQDAEEIVQDVFLRVFRGLPSYRPDKPFVHWLNTITTNACKNQLRSRMRDTRKRSEFAREPSERTTGSNFDPPSARALEEAMEVLDRLTRLAVLLRHVDECTFPEIAEQLEISEFAAKMRVTRGLAKLRERMAIVEAKREE